MCVFKMERWPLQEYKFRGRKDKNKSNDEDNNHNDNNINYEEKKWIDAVINLSSCLFWEKAWWQEQQCVESSRSADM